MADPKAISVSWNGVENILKWTDGSAPWSSGKVGLTIIASEYDQVAFDNVKVMNNVGAIAAWDDYDPWGWVLQGRSGVNGSPDTRYKFTQKERDTETGLDYFGARYYDGRVGRWMGVDPSAENGAEWSPYTYAFDLPTLMVDPDGKWPFVGPILGSTSSNWSGAVTGFVKNAVNTILSYTDVNDATVIATSITRGGDAINVDGSRATTTDKIAALAGAVIPIVSGSLVKKGIEGLAETGSQLIKGADEVVDGAKSVGKTGPNFVVTEGGTAIQVPQGATGPVQVTNEAGKATGFGFTGGSGGANQQVSTVRIMNPTPARGNVRAYPRGYVKYENSHSQGVNPQSGRTVPNNESHIPIDK